MSLGPGSCAASRMWALEPATYQSPAQVEAMGERAPRIPFPIYLVEHPDGLVLFDAGLDPDHAGDPVGGYGEMAERIRIDFREEHLIEHHLAVLGFSLADVSTVVASHLHFDHAGALKQFPHAQTLLGSGEMDYALAPERFASTWFRTEDFDDRHAINWVEVSGDRDLFGDGVVQMLHLPGHTPGSLGLRVRLPGQNLVLSGDAVHTRAAYDAETHYHGDMDSVSARASLRRLAGLLRAEDAELWIAHDPEDWARFDGAGEKR